MLAGVPRHVIEATWRVAGGGVACGFAAADDGERIARDQTTANGRRDPQQSGVQGNRVDRRPAY